jgi:Cof subfamily protein (haloacid dehalogenase superfamily)
MLGDDPMKLFVSDLDGTLLRNNAALSEYGKKTLTELIEQGVHFTVASARSVVAIQKILHRVPIQLPVIEFNGAFISDLQTGKHRIINHINSTIVEELFGIVEDYKCGTFISSFNGKEDCLYYSNLNNEGMNWYYQDRTNQKDRRLRYICDLRDTFKDQIVCFTIINRKENLIELAELIKKTFSNQVEVHLFENQYSPGWYWLTVHDWKSTKDQAIITLVQEYGYDQNQLTVFGDNSNDIKMFKIASEAVAVDNATEELKRYATKIIGTNEEDSVVKYIMEDNMFNA